MQNQATRLYGWLKPLANLHESCENGRLLGHVPGQSVLLIIVTLLFVCSLFPSHSFSIFNCEHWGISIYQYILPQISCRNGGLLIF